ncbi:MAG: AsnC family protein, partial [Bacteroidales bacterium]|nr:AsnC family protein [Bacteroidales bacterium]
MMETLDKTDILILKHLQEDGRITVKDLALKVHLSTTPVFDRMHRLEKEGF